MNSTDNKIEVMQAYSQGKIIEVKRLGHSDWSIAGLPSWNWADFEYRVKLGPIYRLTYPDGSTWETSDIDTAITRWKNGCFNPTLQKIEE